MSCGPKTRTRLLHPSTNVSGGPLGLRRSADGRAVASAEEGTDVTTVICGLAGLALAAVLGVSLASGAPTVAGSEPVPVVIRPPAADMAVFVYGSPFDGVGCTLGTASLR